MQKSDPNRLPWLDRRWYANRPSLKEAQAFCRRLARHHYENFTVVSFLLPLRLRQHFCNVYSYCRIADDLADELGDPELALERIDEWQEQLELCYAGRPIHPVFVALEETVTRFGIPRDPFERLLRAFRQDQTTKRYRTWDELLQYCSNSANPVGHLVLYLCGYRDAERRRLSDDTCTALQLTNFWQDVARDHDRGRIYIPGELMSRYGCTEGQVAERRADEAWASLMRDLLGRTRPLFANGLRLGPLVHPRIRLDIRLFSLGGLEILRAIEDIGYNTLRRRPKLSRWSEGRLIARAIFGASAPGSGTA
jgi:squalene synthase HpnC